jgi:hypothetical protein
MAIIDISFGFRIPNEMLSLLSFFSMDARVKPGHDTNGR